MKLDAQNTYRVASCLVVVSIISCTICLFAICIALPQLRDGGKPLYDYQGVLIAILSILVTVLITWQIWSLINFNKEKAAVEKMSVELENLRNESKIIAKKNRAQTNEAVSDLYNSLLFDKEKLRKDFRFFQYLMSIIDSIRLRSEVNDFEKCSKIIEEFLYDIEEFVDFSLTNDNIEEIKRLYNLINHRNEIERFAELDMVMHNIFFK